MNLLRPVGRVFPVCALLAMAGVAQGFGRLGLAFVLPGIRSELAGSYVVVGLLVTISYIAYTVGSYGVRRASQRWTDRQLLRAGLVVQVASFLLLGIAHSEVTAAIAFALSGIASAVVWLSVTALVNVNASARWRNLSFGATMSSAGLFVAVSGWAITHLPDVDDWTAWRLLLLCQAMVAAFCLASTWFAGIRDAETAAAPDSPARARLRTTRAIRVLTAAFLLFGAAQVLFLNYFVVAVQRDMPITAADANRWFSLLGIASVVGGLVSGKVIDVVGARLCLLLCLVNLAVCAVVVVRAAAVLVPFAAILFGASIAAIGAASVSYLADSVAPDMMSASFALITAGLGVGQVVSPIVGGLLVDLRDSFSPAYALCCAAATLGAVLVFTLPDARRRRVSDV